MRLTNTANAPGVQVQEQDDPINLNYPNPYQKKKKEKGIIKQIRSCLQYYSQEKNYQNI